MKIKLILFFSVLIVSLSNLFAEGNPEQIKCEMTGSQKTISRPINGRYKPARTGPGEYFRVLIAFAQFASDTKPNDEWPLNRLPLWKDDLIDTAVCTTYPDGYRDGTLSDYFDKASLGKLDFIGDVYQDTIVIPGEMKYGDANLYVLKELQKNIPDFRRYDNWKHQDNTFAFSEGNGVESDNSRYLDMLIIIYRNAVDSVFKIAGGIATLGLSKDFIIDSTNNIIVSKSNINSDFLDYKEGGITSRNGLFDKFSLVGHLAHEYGHYLFGENHSYLGGLMVGYPFPETGTYMMNAWERIWLGYISPKTPQIDSQQDTLRDFVKYGDVIVLNVPNPDIYYIIENHQRLHKYDQIVRGGSLDGNYNLNTSTGCGIYIWYIIGGNFNHYPQYINIKSADGSWNWGFDGTYYVQGFYVNTAWADTVPKIKRIAVDRNEGKSDREPYIIQWHNQWFPKWVDTNPVTGEYELTRDLLGEENDAFNIGYNQLLTPWSNPSSYILGKNNTSIELVSKFGNENNYIIKLYSTKEAALTLPPSKPTHVMIDQNKPYATLNWENNIEPDIIDGGFYLIYRSNTSNGTYHPIGKIKHNSSSAVQAFVDTTFPRSNTYYYKVAAVDNTNKISLLSDMVSKDSSFASSCEIWSGNISVTNNLNVPAGKTVIIKEGTSINFENSSHLSVDGTLIIEGTTTSNVLIDFISASTSPANCIFANPGSIVHMNYTEIKNAGLAIFACDAEVQINNCNFHDMYKPVFFYNILYNSYNSFIKNTLISNSLSEGIYLYNSSAYLENNLITHCNAEGLRLSSGSSPTLNKNTIKTSLYGLTAISNSIPLLLGFNSISEYTYHGISLSDHSVVLAGNGFNTFQAPNDKYYYIYTDSYCDAQVRYNYWTADKPDLSKFSIDTTSSLNTGNWLSSDPAAGSSLSKETQFSDLELAYNEFIIGKFDNAENLFKKIIDTKLNKNEAHYSLTGLAACYSKSNKNGFINYLRDDLNLKLSNTETSLYKEYLKYYINCLILEEQYDSALINIQLLQNKYTLNNESLKEIKLHESMINLIFKNDPLKAKIIFERIKSDYPDQRTSNDIDIIISAYNSGVFTNITNVKVNQNLNENVGHIEKIPGNFELSQNYPNPFNPITTIKYALPQNSYVILDIFNIIGEKITTLISEVKNAGYHEEIFSAGSFGSKLSSGIYIYRINAVSLETGTQFIKSAKMVLVK